MPAYKEYLQTNERLTVDGVKKLRVVMNTPEFGVMVSKTIDQVADEAINERLLLTLGDDLINEYERRLLPKKLITGW